MRYVLYKPKKQNIMNKGQKAALLAANNANVVISENEVIVKAEIKEIKAEQKDKETFNEGKPEPIQHKPTANVDSFQAVDLAKESRQVVKKDVIKVVNSFERKMSVLLEICQTPNGKNYLKHNNLKIEDISKKQVLKTLTSLVINGKNLHVRITELKEDKSNLLTVENLAVYLGGLDENGVFVNTEINTIEVKYSVLDRNYDFDQNENGLLLTKGKKVYTFAIIETLPYSIIIDRLAKYRKIANVQAAKLVQSRIDAKHKAEKLEAENLAKAEKAEKAKALVLSSFSKAELLAMASLAS